MEVLLDAHTHTVASGHHTKDTAVDLAKKAAQIGLQYLSITDHAPKMIGSATESYFRNLKYAPKERFGVKLIYGAELNVLGRNGEVDLPPNVTNELAFCIASLHKDVCRPSTEEVNTAALINAMKNKDVCVIGHPDNPDFKINCHALIDAAKDNEVMIELNSAGVSKNGYRENNLPFLVETMLLAKQKGVYVVLGSDSHGKDNIADFDDSLKLLKMLDFPRELVVNYRPELFFERIKKHRGI